MADTAIAASLQIWEALVLVAQLSVEEEVEGLKLLVKEEEEM